MLLLIVGVGGCNVVGGGGGVLRSESGSFVKQEAKGASLSPKVWCGLASYLAAF